MARNSQTSEFDGLKPPDCRLWRSDALQTSESEGLKLSAFRVGRSETSRSLKLQGFNVWSSKPSEFEPPKLSAFRASRLEAPKQEGLKVWSPRACPGCSKLEFPLTPGFEGLKLSTFVWNPQTSMCAWVFRFLWGPIPLKVQNLKVWNSQPSEFEGRKPCNFRVWRSQTPTLQSFKIWTSQSSEFEALKLSALRVWRSVTLKLRGLKVWNPQASEFEGLKLSNFRV